MWHERKQVPQSHYNSTTSTVVSANSDVEPDDEVGVGAIEDNCTPDLFVAENADVSQAEAVDGTVCVEIPAESNNSKPAFTFPRAVKQRSRLTVARQRTFRIEATKTAVQDDANSHNAEVGQTVQAKRTARQKCTMSQTNLDKKPSYR